MDMYHIQPVNPAKHDISLPSCMYPMKNLHTSSEVNGLGGGYLRTSNVDIMEQVKRVLKEPLPELVNLEIQQEEILKKLALLKSQIMNFRLQLNDPVVKKSSLNISLPLGASLRDIVVFANPDVAPYSLLALKALWNESPSINISCHAHSSLDHPVSPAVLHAFEQNVGNIMPNCLQITLIWKQVGKNLQVVASPTRNVILEGEVNLLRLLSHVGPHQLSLDALSAEEQTSVDWALDLVYQLAQNPHPSKELLASLSKITLGEKGWLLHKQDLSVVDIALWSYLKSKASVDCPPKLKNWMKNCNNLFLK